MAKKEAIIKRVFILGMDGAGNFVQQAQTPFLDAFLPQGAYTYAAQAESPTISAECWGSVLHGVVPARHGLTNEIAATEPYPAESPYPSLFRLAREQLPQAKLASFTGWGPINDGIIERNAGVEKLSAPDAELVPELIRYLEANPDAALLFLQLDEPDGSGHRYGYGPDSLPYLQAISECDRLLGSVVDAIGRLGLLEDSLIILLTDHGGGGADKFSHGSEHEMDKNVFWGCVGPGIAPGELTAPVSIKDTAAVAARALGLQLPSGVDARIPEGLFGT
ncbi:alkaline phosphatase family protein [Paenibacillus humicus]|uniref:alkaline phosphatase family protein n=1 Tax=Paenibacillus humicus TaxID=412861 RepID=UPI000FD7A5AA|nr:alkaline phosphatase family protein [Paenibacillus humicus]